MVSKVLSKVEQAVRVCSIYEAHTERAQGIQKSSCILYINGWVVWVVQVWVEYFRDTRAKMGKRSSASYIGILVLNSSRGAALRNQGTWVTEQVVGLLEGRCISDILPAYPLRAKSQGYVFHRSWRNVKGVWEMGILFRYPMILADSSGVLSVHRGT